MVHTICQFKRQCCIEKTENSCRRVIRPAGLVKPTFSTAISDAMCQLILEMYNRCCSRACNQHQSSDAYCTIAYKSALFLAQRITFIDCRTDFFMIIKLYLKKNRCLYRVLFESHISVKHFGFFFNRARLFLMSNRGWKLNSLILQNNNESD